MLQSPERKASFHSYRLVPLWGIENQHKGSSLMAITNLGLFYFRGNLSGLPQQLHLSYCSRILLENPEAQARGLLGRLPFF